MNKRNFLKALAAVTAVTTFSGPMLGMAQVSSKEYRLSPEREYTQLAAIEVRITDMIGDSQRTVLSTSNKPIIIPEARRPIAVVLAEHDSEHVSLTLLEQDESGNWIKASHSYAGFESTQILRSYGIVLNLFAERF